MKKTISINISGILFHIEEDGYESLRKYLDSINHYFGSFEDSREILADIENRIAEIFHTKLKDGKQVISIEDVQSLMATMGSINDFKAAEDTDEPHHENASSTQEEKKQFNHAQPATSKKLVRDPRRKILGGVCAGLAHYFSIDPVWVRIAFGVLTPFFGSSILVYLILWIVLPNEQNIEDEPSVKKMYRNPDKKVLGGVAGGVAAYFGIDVVLVRLLFIALLFAGGFGILLYIILWVSLQEAKTITEKMEMQGEPVTLSNIESSVKKSLNEKDEKESVLAKIILFPFRALAEVIRFLGAILSPIVKGIVDILRVFIGVVISTIGLSFILAIVVSFGMVLGIFSTSLFESWNIGTLGLPIEAIKFTFPVASAIAAFLVVLIPSIFIVLLGISVIAKRIVFRAFVGWSLFVLFFVSVLALSFMLPQIIFSFKEEGDYKTEKIFDANGKTIVLKINETGLDDYQMTDLTLRGYDGKQIKLIQKFSAQGSSRKNAIENARSVSYQVQQMDSTILFDSNITFNTGAPFHAQRLDMELYIPYNTKMVISEHLWRLIDNNPEDYYGYRDANLDKTWVMKENGLTCVNCADPTESKVLEMHDQFGLKDFDEIDIKGVFNVVIRQGDAYSVEIIGSERERKKYSVEKHGDLLEIDYRSQNKIFWTSKPEGEDLTKIQITVAHLSKLKVKGVGKIQIEGFDENDMRIALTGALVGEADVKAQNLELELSGPIIFELDGRGDFLEADLSKVAQLKASGYEVRHALVTAKELSQARLHVTEQIETETDVTSSVKYQGNPEVIKKD